MPQPTDAIMLIATDVNGIDGFPNKERPISPLTTTGYSAQGVGYQQLNYLFNNQAQWLAFHSEEDAAIRNEFALEDTSLHDRLDTLTQTVADLSAQVIKERVSIGEIIEITGDSTNPAILKGYGIWIPFAAGQVLVGVGPCTDSNGDTLNWGGGFGAQYSRGTYNHRITPEQAPKHSHGFSGTTGGGGAHSHTLPSHSGGSGDLNAPVPNAGSDENPIGTTTSEAVDHTHTFSGQSEASLGRVTGDNDTISMMQPTLAVYRWERVT